MKWLPDPALLPQGVHLIVSTRPELLEHSAFAAKFGRDKAEWLELGGMADAEVRALLYQVRSKYAVLEAGEYVDAIVKQSEGSPLYLRMLLEDLEEGRLTFGHIDELPHGVIAYFERILKFIEGEGRTREMPGLGPLLRAKQETLDALIAQGILTQEQANAQLERERAALEGQAGVKSAELLALYCLVKEPFSLGEAATVLGVDLTEAQRAFDVIRTVLIDDGKGRFAVFHTGFRNYFLHLGDYTETQFHRHADTIARIQDRLLVYCARWREHKGHYALQHYAEHLREAKRWDELFALARAEAFRQMQVQAFPDDPDAPLRTVRTALLGATEADNAAAMAEFLRAHVQLLIDTMQESPLDTLRAGNLERAWQLADLGEMRLCALWYLLLAWELEDTGKVEESRETLERLQEKELSLLHPTEAKMIFGIDSKFVEVALAATREIERKEERVKALRDSAVARAWAGDKEGARAIFATALEAARADKWESLLLYWLKEKRRELRVSIAVAQARAGDKEGAQATFAAILKAVRREEKMEVLGEIAIAQAQMGQFAAALETVQEIKGEMAQTWELASIARGLMRVGEVAAALEIARKIKQEERRAEALRDIAMAQAQAGEIAAALEIAREIGREEERAEALRDIAMAQAQAGAKEAAQLTFAAALEAALAAEWQDVLAALERKRWKFPASTAVAQAQMGEKEAARATFAAVLRAVREEQEGWWRAEALRDIAVAQAQAGEKEAARATFAAVLEVLQEEGVGEGFRRGWGLREIAEGQAQAGEFAAALETVQDIEGEEHRAEALAAIAMGQAQAGEFAAALETAQRIEAAYKRGEALASIAAAQAQAGEFAAALESVQGIQFERELVKALRDIAVAQMQAGEIAAALEIAQEIGSGEMLMSIARTQAQAGEFAAALESVQKIASAGERVEALWDVAEAQARAGEKEAARAIRQAARTAFAEALEAGQNSEWGQQWEEALAPVAVALAQAGKFAAALQIAQKMAAASKVARRRWWKEISTRSELTEVLVAIATAQAQAGEREVARETFAVARKTAQGLEREASRAGALESIATAQARVGEVALPLRQRG